MKYKIYADWLSRMELTVSASGSILGRSRSTIKSWRKKDEVPDQYMATMKEYERIQLLDEKKMLKDRIRVLNLRLGTL